MTGFTPALTLRQQLARAPVNLADSFGFDSKPAFEAPSSIHFCTAMCG
jgi:hypothetical protein